MAQRGTTVFRLSTRGAGRKASEFSRLARGVQDDIIAEVRALGRAAQQIFYDAAPSDTDDLRARIDAVPFFGRASRPRVSIRIRPDAQGHQGDTIDGYDYLGVTRRGHRKKLIVPKRARALKVHIEGHRNAQIFVFRRSVRGTTTTDWVLPAAERADRIAIASERRLARRIESRVLR